MADGFIVRKGGVAVAGEPIPAPTITLVSKTDSSITFTLTNNSIAEQDVTFGLTTPPTTTTITLASLATSNNQTFTGFTPEQTVTIFAQAADGIIGQLSVTTNARIFTAATGGTTLEYNSGGKRFKSHTFTSNGNFVVSTVGNDDRNQVDYLIIAGGGGGGNGGGGAGGYRTTNGTSGGPNPTTESKVTVTATTFGVTIGGGGTGKTSGRVDTATSGANSSIAFPSTITSIAGSRGTSNNGSNSPQPPIGGSGGGCGGGDANLGGLGTANQGHNGGNGAPGGGFFNAGGGGGAGQAGENGLSNATGMFGGNGLANTLRTGSSETRAGGGGGGALTNTTAGPGGAGGGGNSGTGSSITGQNATANTGSGGGGASAATISFAGIGVGGNGAGGVVVIRYEIATV